MRSSLAVIFTSTPLVLTATKFRTRRKFKGTLALKRHVDPPRVPIETKELPLSGDLRQPIALLRRAESCIHVHLGRVFSSQSANAQQ